MTDQRDTIILGSGLIGMSQALALAAHGVTSHVIDHADPAAMLAPDADGRTSAISSSSMAMLQAIGLGDVLAGKGCAIERIWVSEGLGAGALDFAPDADDGALGHMFENRLLRRTLFDAARANPRITLHMPVTVAARERAADGVRVTLTDGRTLTAPLLIVAEGRGSPTRDEAGINVARWSYDHMGIVTVIHHDRPHDHVAYEIFYPTGPFAVLPMLDDADGRHRSALVWSLPRAMAPAMAKLSGRGFAHEVERAMGGMLGSVSLAAPRTLYPLGFHHTARITARRLALIGDAAHGIHPIAGQGLNLGLRDVAALTEVVVEGMRFGLDPADPELLARYERWRGFDALSVAFATDTLNRLFGIPGHAPSAARRFGLGLVQKLPPAKRFFMAAARGNLGTLPKLLNGALV